MKSLDGSNSVKEMLFYIIILSGLGWLIYTYRVVIGPLIISALIAYLLYPSVTWLSNRTKLKRRWIVIIVYLVFIIFIIWTIIYLTPVIVKQANFLSRQLAMLPNQIDLLQNDLEIWLGFKLPLETITEELEADLGQLLKPEQIFRLILSATSNIMWLFVIFITTFHLLRDWERMREWLFGLLPEPSRPEYRRLHQEIKKLWQSYLRGQLLIMFLLGLLSGVGAAVIGLPSALLLGFLAGALALIPSLGPAIATAIAAGVAWTQGSTYLEISNVTLTLIVVAIFQIVQLIEGFWLTPRIMGRRMSLHPGIVLVAVIGTLFTLGALMALIVVPIIGSLSLITRFVQRKRAGLDPWLLDEIQEDPSFLD